MAAAPLDGREAFRAYYLALFAERFPAEAAAIAVAETEPCGPGCRCTTQNANLSDPPCRESRERLSAAQRLAPARPDTSQTGD